MLFLELPIINLKTKRIKAEMLFKLSNLNSNFALTLGYLNPALNNSAMRFASPREGSYQVALSFFLDLKTIPSSFTCERLSPFN